ncbi:MAG TPA: hypothetical protein VMI56_00755 [Reyranella sp.]|nr:hypothetical protein [Reyranella sp.]
MSVRPALFSRVVFACVVFACSGAVQAQAPSFDERPTGFLTQKTGGMQPDAWQGTSLAQAKRLVAALPAAPRSRALRDLQFKLMVSELTPPAPDNSPPPSLFARKVERLAAMGEGESLNEMVRASGGYADPAVAAIDVNALMMVGERDAACAALKNSALTGLFATRAAVTCQLVAGDNAGALADVAALRARDAGFAAMVQAAAGSTAPVAAPRGEVDGPAMALMALAHIVPPATLYRSDQPLVIRSLVGQRTLPIATRLDIAERGEALAVIEATRLSELYVEAVKGGVVLPPAMARRAQLVFAVRNAANPKEIMASIAAVYSESRGPMFPTVARASAVGLLSLPPKPEYADVAQEAIRGFLLLGDKQLTQAWTKLALKAAYNSARALNALDRLIPLVAVAGIDDPHHLPAEEINRWYELMRQDDAKGAPLRGYLMLQLLRSSGIDVPAGTTDLPEAPPPGVRLVSPPAATMQALQAAGAAHRRAEAALLASAAIAETSLADLHPAAVAAIVRALIAAGEDQAGRLFAIEVAIARGL